ncbi:eCIS core domain-containing protein [Ralstonia solanacearum]|uniref:eCIS core domain-containing protein n=1 Tax=Ralstonia solanacearum TaxID=305 RepID=UPI00078C457A|nr:DUF4157 domain-containing protein [Ralstonia solanacearum]AMP37649.1 hypothetical protein LBM2029_08915 [Ralstonia solanacearum]AXV86475.1 hypothetical protein CJO78_09235 [Ralstonia solanacearum]AXW05977.1 hypothetical protein CJO82_09010 [Ralstonia solanacearum]AXW23721.1 hypothetical protein CJO86_09015 [Ralstonia solanacearum]AXW80653.1 hypothetical protein CJO98_09245 [Ralstonia solanacearum]
MSTYKTAQPAAAKPAAMESANLVLRRKCACGAGASSLSGECEECSKKKRGAQRKLTIGASNDPLEREADQVADQVMAASAPQAVRAAAPSLQRAASSASGQAGMAPASVDKACASPGKPLDPALRQDMEQRFGHDFSRVQVHRGEAAEASARDVHAQAYTVGRDIVFGAGRFAPDTAVGRRLLAHELTHVVQQSALDEPPLRRAPDAETEQPVPVAGQEAPEAQGDPTAEDPADGYVEGADNEVAPDDAAVPDDDATLDDDTASEAVGKADETAAATPLQSKVQAPTTGKWILVKLPGTLIRFKGTKRISSWGISGGRPGHATPKGSFTIFDRDEDHRSTSYGKCDGKPIGPDGLNKCNKTGGTYVGADMHYFQEFASGGVGFHRGDPGVQSHGCIHVSSGNAKTLWDWSAKGTPVVVCEGSGCDPYLGGGASKGKGKGKSKGKPKALQPRLEIGAVDDPLEQEADRVAEQVMAAPAHHAVGAAPPRVQRFAGPSHGQNDAAPASVDHALASSGTPLEPSLRQDMEQRFGHDFARVRVHTDSLAARSAKEIAAQAYAAGPHIVFGEGRFSPSTPEGRRLVAHELTHVVQQGAADSGQAIRRKGGGLLDDLGLGDLADLPKALAKGAEEEVRKQLRSLAALPGTGALFSASGCPSNFCNPFKDVGQARVNLAATAPFLLIGVAKVVSPRVVPLWKDYLFGGSAPRDLTSDFGADFTASKTTQETADFIVSQLKKEVAANHNAIMGPAASVTVDLTARMSKTLAAIDVPKGTHAMNFNKIGEIPGNLAGGIGKDQLAHQIGAQPSPFNDDRTATVQATLTRTASTIKVKPAIRFKIHDTIDLCPGDCGAVTERDATVPMSRFEATGLSGDVPFVVEFPAPASALGEFGVAVPKAKSPSGKPKKSKPPAKSSGKKKASLDEPLEHTDPLATADPTGGDLNLNEEQEMADDGAQADNDGEVSV